MEKCMSISRSLQCTAGYSSLREFRLALWLEPGEQGSAAIVGQVDAGEGVRCLGAVPVGAAGAGGAELVGHGDPARALARIVGAVVGLDAGEAVGMVAAGVVRAPLVVEGRVGG